MGLEGSWKGWAQGPPARRKVPGSGKVAGGRPALPLPVAACCVTLGLCAQPLSPFRDREEGSEVPWGREVALPGGVAVRTSVFWSLGG